MAKVAGSDDLEPVRLGPEGFAMLGLSGAIMLLSLGASLLLALAYVLRIALFTPSTTPPGSRIIVLGMRFAANGAIHSRYRLRLDRAWTLWRMSEQSRIVILGGVTTRGACSEAQAGAACLQALGVPAEAIETEDRSRHTLENLMLYRARYPADRRETPVLVTSRFHLARSSLLASSLGIAHRRCAAETTPWVALRHVPRMLHEALLIHWYVTSRSFARLTRNQRIAARIT